MQATYLKLKNLFDEAQRYVVSGSIIYDAKSSTKFVEHINKLLDIIFNGAVKQYEPKYEPIKEELLDMEPEYESESEQESIKEELLDMEPECEQEPINEEILDKEPEYESESEQESIKEELLDMEPECEQEPINEELLDKEPKYEPEQETHPKPPAPRSKYSPPSTPIATMVTSKVTSHEIPMDLSYVSPDSQQTKQVSLVAETILNVCMGNHAVNVLFEGLQKNPSCELKETMKSMKNKNELNKGPNNVDVCTVTENVKKIQCKNCISSVNTNFKSCFICLESDKHCIPCCEKKCGKSYHIACLKYWQQHKIQYKQNKVIEIHCPRHVCHTCTAPEIRSLNHNRESDNRLIKCILCPGTYHRFSKCIPAGSELLSMAQMICPRHQIVNESGKHYNVDFCTFCTFGGKLVCCDSCPNAFHNECLPVTPGKNFVCEECESGRRPLYGEIVWCKYVNSTWWPAVTVPPHMIPRSVLINKKVPNQICVYFFGTHNYGWVSHHQIYLFKSGDDIDSEKEKTIKSKEAVKEAEYWLNQFQDILQKNGRSVKNSKPPNYRIIKTNRMLVKNKEDDYFECNCLPEDLAPCGIGSNCINAATNIECDPEQCPAKDKCQNQNFHKGKQYDVEIRLTEFKGWGLFAKEEIPAETFVMEYLGEVIDNFEFQDRFKRAKSDNADNYYFATLGKNLYIDAEFEGNEARFINHSCNPNTKTENFCVYHKGKGETKLGIYSTRKISIGEEITYDYKWSTKKFIHEFTAESAICCCDSPNCTGYI
ncbi:probable histone-lysine N-methyltransferase Mes-4 [Contarinia nasturtii]|uniref:probable histone-lysine N-methyltransferase Mes-4 n=1 Tax=Contarinia nasturtii TaxID=265458 RepID=UPI0012D3F152|nr:probable histone-lysine N-methyltransferase Mes-4 [Contarinia nasturtii]